MKVIGIVGWSGSGKTTLLTRLIPLLRAEGLTVSTVKHTHHGFDMDRPGKDTYRHREAGAREVLVAAGSRWALLHEVAGPEPGLPDLLTGLNRSTSSWWKASRPTRSQNWRYIARRWASRRSGPSSRRSRRLPPI